MNEDGWRTVRFPEVFVDEIVQLVIVNQHDNGYLCELIENFICL